MNGEPSPAFTYDRQPRSDLRRFLLTLRLAGRDLLEQMSLFGMGNLVAAFLLLIPPLFPLALAGLWRAAALVAQEEEPGWEALWDGATHHIERTLGLTGAAALGYALCAMNLRFYGLEEVPLPFPADERLLLAVQLFWGVVALLWTLYWLYVAGCLALDAPSTREALTCAAHLLTAHPLFAFLLGLLLLALLLLTAYVPALLVLLVWAGMAVLSVRSVQLLRHGVPVPVRR